jgi:hypothetical protein
VLEGPGGVVDLGRVRADALNKVVRVIMRSVEVGMEYMYDRLLLLIPAFSLSKKASHPALIC